MKVCPREIFHSGKKRARQTAEILAQALKPKKGIRDHILITDGCFRGENEFTRAPAFDWDKLEELFKQKIFRLLLKGVRITEELVEKVGNWQHSSFHVCGEPIEPGNQTSMGNLARYIIRASLSQERTGRAG